MIDKKENNYRDVFIPNSPTNNPEFLFGRENEIKVIKEAILSPGAHIMVVGGRGIGKTSLVLCCTVFPGINIIKVRCDRKTTFSKLFEIILMEAGFDINKIESSTERTKQFSAKFSPFNIGTMGSGSETKRVKRRETGSEELDPFKVFCLLRDLKGKYIIFIDEYDAIPSNNKEIHESMASLIKHLSDHRNSFGYAKGSDWIPKIIIAGIAKSTNELFGHHQSIERNIVTVKLERLDVLSIYEFLGKTEATLNFKFEESVKRYISIGSKGHPYYAHLFGKECYILMQNRNETSRFVTTEDYKNAFKIVTNQLFESQQIKYKHLLKELDFNERFIINSITDNSFYSISDLRKVFMSKSMSKGEDNKKANDNFEKAIAQLEIKEIIVINKEDGLLGLKDPLLAPFISAWLVRGKFDDILFDILSSGI